jgi:transketolase C-terminal domain/subunit
MAAAKLTASDAVMRVVAVGLALTGITMFVCGIAMFWGPLRQVLAAPVVMALGVAVYVGGRAGWWIVEEGRRTRP